jgi:hypothetical protein
MNSGSRSATGQWPRRLGLFYTDVASRSARAGARRRRVRGFRSGGWRERHLRIAGPRKGRPRRGGELEQAGDLAALARRNCRYRKSKDTGGLWVRAPPAGSDERLCVLRYRPTAPSVVTYLDRVAPWQGWTGRRLSGVRAVATCGCTLCGSGHNGGSKIKSCGPEVGGYPSNTDYPVLVHSHMAKITIAG